MRYGIVTGVSKGLGESVAKILMEAGIHVIGISRSINDSLNEIARQNNVSFHHFTCDLGDVDAIEETFGHMSSLIFSEEPSSVYLVNNAAVLDPIDKSMNLDSHGLAYHVKVNSLAPMVLTNLFLEKATEKDVPLIGATITSGAAERPVYGWSAYCSTKASINMYTKTAALEQDELKTRNKVIAFSPGVMDTQMQEKIRASNKDEFIEVDTFKGYKNKNLLKDTDAIGGVLVDILTDESSVENGKIYNVKDYF
ncbi:(S)-benzoin forming benzil reductase [Virgibacillus siamensis]|uniref:(S)-benzoin forming benzil reductase n=1 Tax=Virgibacillus siamensis TaxID=480071 RepID=UPI000987043A|nr:(S)-benzoin forming benzil reductase [Virgibacillus siamensis]